VNIPTTKEEKPPVGEAKAGSQLAEAVIGKKEETEITETEPAKTEGKKEETKKEETTKQEEQTPPKKTTKEIAKEIIEKQKDIIGRLAIDDYRR
jgi:hypothetical protein